MLDGRWLAAATVEWRRGVPLVWLTLAGVSLWHDSRSECGRSAWLVRVYNRRDPETKKRNYLNQTVRGRLWEVQADLNRLLGFGLDVSAH